MFCIVKFFLTCTLTYHYIICINERNHSYRAGHVYRDIIQEIINKIPRIVFICNKKFGIGNQTIQFNFKHPWKNSEFLHPDLRWKLFDG